MCSIAVNLQNAWRILKHWSPIHVQQNPLIPYIYTDKIKVFGAWLNCCLSQVVIFLRKLISSIFDHPTYLSLMDVNWSRKSSLAKTRCVPFNEIPSLVVYHFLLAHAILWQRARSQQHSSTNGIKIKQARQFDKGRTVDLWASILSRRMHKFKMWWVLPFDNYVKDVHLGAYEPATVYGQLQQTWVYVWVEVQRKWLYTIKGGTDTYRTCCDGLHNLYRPVVQEPTCRWSTRFSDQRCYTGKVGTYFGEVSWSQEMGRRRIFRVLYTTTSSQWSSEHRQRMICLWTSVYLTQRTTLLTVCQESFRNLTSKDIKE